MPDQYAIVITTINYPTRAVMEIARDASTLNAQLILIGDRKSPADFHQQGSIYLDLEAQKRSGFRYAEIAPAQHYARKNVGYLKAIADGATIIIETDDDNIPLRDFWAPRSPMAHARSIDGSGWVNIYRYFQDGVVWPRGLPLDCVNAPIAELGPVEAVYCPIQQGLADENPDVDAIYRLLLPIPLRFKRTEPIALRRAWSPFNSQNTTWWPEAYPLLYLPYYCSFRMTDIWRSFVAQRIAYANDWGVLYHAATVFQERNEHDLMRDFADEIPGYLHNAAIHNELEAMQIDPGRERISEMMRRCYERLIAMGLVDEKELPLLDAWLCDLAALKPHS